MDGRKKSTLGYRWVQASYEVLELASPADPQEALSVVHQAATAFRGMCRGRTAVSSDNAAAAAAAANGGGGGGDSTAVVAAGSASSGSGSVVAGSLWTQGGEVADAFVQALVDAALDALPPVIGRPALQQAEVEAAAAATSGSGVGGGLSAPLPPLSLFADPTNGRSLGAAALKSGSGALTATTVGKGRWPKSDGSAKITGGSGLLDAGTPVSVRSDWVVRCTCSSQKHVFSEDSAITPFSFRTQPHQKAFAHS